MMNDNKHTYQQLKSYFDNEIFEKEELVTMIHENKLYDVCFDLALTNDNPAAWRSAWVLAACREKHPEPCQKYLPEVIRALPSITRDGQIRELLKIFRNLAYEELPEKEMGLLFDFCMHTFQDAAKQPGTRSTALHVLLIFARKEPDLLGEIQAAFHFIKPQLSKGIRQSCEHKINRLQNEYEC